MTDHLTSSLEVEARCTRILRSFLTGERLVDITPDLSPRVLVRTPTFRTATRRAALLAIQDGVLCGESLTEVALTVAHLDVAWPRAHLEWGLSGRFTSPSFVDDDRLIEPTGALVDLRGILSITFAGPVAVGVTCYYDQLHLLRQMEQERST